MGDMVIADAMFVEQLSQLSVFLGDPPSSGLDLSRRLDTLELA